jgi:hypothetical protein
VDLTCLLSEFNRVPLNFPNADIDGNGIVNAADLTYLLAGFNKRNVIKTAYPVTKTAFKKLVDRLEAEGTSFNAPYGDPASIIDYLERAIRQFVEDKGLEPFSIEVRQGTGENGKYYLINPDKGEDYEIKYTISSDDAITRTISCVAEQSYVITVSLHNIASFTGKEYTLTYDSNMLTLTNFAAQTKAITTAVGPIPGADIEITAVGQGLVKYKVNKTIPESKLYSGTITLVEFTAKNSGTADISISK